MSVLISDLVFYGTASMPEADGATAGGAIDFTKRVEFDGTALTPTLFDAVSSSASDTATKIIYSGRDSTGVIQTETLTFNGTTKVAGTKSLERLLSALTSGAATAFGLTTPGGTQAVGDVALMSHTMVITAHTMQAGSANATTSNPPTAKLQSGDGASVTAGMILHTTGGTGPNQIRRILAVNPNGLGADVVAVNRNWGTIPDATTTYEVAHGMCFDLTGSNGGVAITGTSTQTLGITRLFTGATSNVTGGASITFYEEVFVNNNNQTTALTVASVLLQALSVAVPGTGALNMALANALNNTATITNRQTAPTAVTSYTSGAPPQTVAVPSPQNLPASLGAADATGAQKIILQLVAPAGTPAWESTITLRATGSSS